MLQQQQTDVEGFSVGEAAVELAVESGIGDGHHGSHGPRRQARIAAPVPGADVGQQADAQTGFVAHDAMGGRQNGVGSDEGPGAVEAHDAVALQQQSNGRWGDVVVAGGAAANDGLVGDAGGGDVGDVDGSLIAATGDTCHREHADESGSAGTHGNSWQVWLAGSQPVTWHSPTRVPSTVVAKTMSALPLSQGVPLKVKQRGDDNATQRASAGQSTLAVHGPRPPAKRFGHWESVRQGRSSQA